MFSRTDTLSKRPVASPGLCFQPDFGHLDWPWFDYALPHSNHVTLERLGDLSNFSFLHL